MRDFLYQAQDCNLNLPQKKNLRIPYLLYNQLSCKNILVKQIPSILFFLFFLKFETAYCSFLQVSLATGFLFLGGGMRTFSTNNGSLAMLLITLYPRLPSGPNDNRCHLQASVNLFFIRSFLLCLVGCCLCLLSSCCDMLWPEYI